MTQVLIGQEDLPSVVENFSSSRANEYLMKLCSTGLEGRRVGTAGHERAQAWLLAQWQEMNLKAEIFSVPGVTVRDLYAAPTLSRHTRDGRLIQSYRHRSEFSEHPRSADQPQPIQGLAQRDKDGNLKDAWVMLDTFPKGQELTRLGERLQDHGAIGILVPQRVTSEGYLPKLLMSQSPISLPVISVHAEKWPTLEGSQVRASVPLRTSVVEAGNVIAKFQGHEPSLETAPLIIGAHFDAVGDDPSGYRIPGAGDNAAGIAVIL